MDFTRENFRISDRKEQIQFDRVEGLLKNSYWASERSAETIFMSIEHSICFSLFCDNVQIGFARVVTDFATVAYICDVIIAPEYRGKGLGKWLVDVLVNDSRWSQKFQFLATNDAHCLYEKFGFSGSHKLMSTKV